MFFSKVVLFAISLGAISVLATPHALHHHALHRRAVAARAVVARVASAPSNSSEVTVKRQNSAKCINRPPSSSSPSIPAATPNVQNTPIVQKPPVVSPPAATPTPTPTPTPIPHQETPPAPKTTTSSPAPTNTPPPSSGGGGGGGSFSGDGTFFSTGLGSCGMTNKDTDYIVAVSEILYDAASNGPNPNSNPLCGKRISISYGGATATATIVDRCTGCAKYSIDMTISLFQVFAPLSVGRIHNVEWSFLD